MLLKNRTELKNVKPKFNNDYAYDYKTVESNPDVKSEFAIYALNNSKVSLRRNNFSITSFDSSLKNSAKLKSSEKFDYKSNRFDNSLKKFYFNTEENGKKNSKLILEEDSFDMDFFEEEEEDCDDFKSHIQDIISKNNKVKFVHIK